jgi:hypothetical protein
MLLRMPFLMQPSPFPGLGLGQPMGQIMVEAGDLNANDDGTLKTD